MRKRFLSLFMSLIMAISLVGVMPAAMVGAASAKMESALQWAINIANDNSHGYSQTSRWGPDYDCSSFVISALKSAGYDVGSATYTGNMRSQLTARGFTWIPWSQIGSVSNLKRGDILLNEKTHTEFYLGNNTNVGAHSNRGYPQTGDQTGTEVSVSGYYYHPWDGVLRENYTPNPPSNLSITTDKACYKVGETITFSFTSNDSTELYIPIDYNGVRSEFINVSGRTSYTCSFSQPGWYGFYLYAKNSSGESSTVGDYKNIRVDNTAPSDLSISTNKKIYYAGENVCFSFNSINAAELYIPIDVNGTREHFIDVSSKTSYSRSFTTTGVYYYTLYGRNAVGDCGAQYSPFYVFNKPNLGDEFYAKIKVKAEPEFLLSNVSDALILQSEDNNKSLEQTWKFKKNSDGSFGITSLSTGNAIDLENWTDADGANVALHKYANTTNQNWNIYEIEKNVYSFGPQCSNMRVLDVPFEKFDNGTSIKMHEFLGSAAQKFIIEKVSCPHNYTSKVIESATCTTDGLQIRTCLICGETETQTIPETGHNYTSKVIAPTLIAQGYTLYTCSVCGDSYKDNYVSPLRETQLKYQLAKLANGTYAVRFVFAVDEEEAIAAKKASIYLTTKNGTNTKETPFNTAYRSIYAGGKLVSAGEGKVFLTAKYVNIPEEELNLLATLNFDGDIYTRNVQI